MKNKTVKEKVTRLINKKLLNIDSNGYAEISVDGLDKLINKIDKLYRKEMLEEIDALVEVCPVVSLEGQQMVELSWHNYLNLRDRLANVKKNKIKVLKKMPKAYISYTCCNIEVSEPKGTEVHCSGCGEWCQTK